MPTYMLEPGTAVLLPAKTLLVEVQSVDPQAKLPLVRVQPAAGAGHQPVVREQGGRFVLQGLDGPSVVRLVPPAGVDLFGPGTVVSVTVDSWESRDSRVVLNGVDVSGLRSFDLVEVEPAGTNLRLTAVGTADETQRPDVPLHPLAQLARDAARQVLGVPQVEPDAAVDVTAVIDISASMRHNISAGEVLATLQLLTGLAGVIAPARRFRVALRGARNQWLPDSPPADLAAAAQSALEQAPLSSGFRSSSIPAEQGARSLTFLITDGVPADLPTTVADAENDHGLRHLIMLQPAGADEVDLGLPYTLLPVADLGQGSLIAAVAPDDCLVMVRSLLAGLERTGADLGGLRGD